MSDGDLLSTAKPAAYKKIRSSDVCAALALRFAAPEWALFFEVGSATGTNGKTYADAVAMNLFPSRGLALHGIEIKVSRGDWLNELKQPEKSAPVQQYCDFWWLAAPKGCVNVDELPMTWGYLELQGTTRLVCVKKAPQLTPVALNRGFAAALIRRAGQADATRLRQAVEKETKDIHDRLIDRQDRAIEERTRSYTRLKEQVDAFEEASGIKISEYGDGKRIGEGVAALFFNKWDSLPNKLKDLRAKLQSMSVDVDKALFEFGETGEKIG